MASAKPTCMRSLLSNLVENDELGKLVIAIRALIVNDILYGPNKNQYICLCTFNVQATDVANRISG